MDAVIFNKLVCALFHCFIRSCLLHTDDGTRLHFFPPTKLERSYHNTAACEQMSERKEPQQKIITRKQSFVVLRLYNDADASGKAGVVGKNLLVGGASTAVSASL